MYLRKKTYVQNWDHTPKKNKYKITITKGGKAVHDIDTKKIVYIEEDAGYWRKANQIHNWFVTNVQDGLDDCRSYSVERTQLEELLSLVKEVIKKPAKAHSLLPVKDGFLFGNDEYDEYYFKDLTMTKKMLEDILKEPDNGEFYYQSSW